MLIEELKAIQLRQNLKDEGFALLLGIHRGTWNRIKNYQQPAGIKFLKNVRSTFPELKREVDIFLLGDITNGKELVTASSEGE